MLSSRPSSSRTGFVAPKSVRGTQRASVIVHNSSKWDTKYMHLKRNDCKTVAPEELANYQDWVVVDVRPSKMYSEAHIQGAQSCPLWEPLDFAKAKPTDLMRGLLQAANGVTPVYQNPDFEETLRKIAASSKGQLLFYCETGGSIDPTPNFPTGKASRSLEAAFFAHYKGICKDVGHLQGGIYRAWKSNAVPIEGEYDPSNAGRTPGAAAEAKIDERFLKRDA